MSIMSLVLKVVKKAPVKKIVSTVAQTVRKKSGKNTKSIFSKIPADCNPLSTFVQNHKNIKPITLEDLRRSKLFQDQFMQTKKWDYSEKLLAGLKA